MTSSATGSPEVLAICICTLRRPVLLEKLLGALDAQRLPPEVANRVRLVLVENESHGPGRSVAERYAQAGRFPLTYFAEASRGIAHARNRCLMLALQHKAGWIAFIDDDEWPAPDWLAGLLEAQARLGADVVTGPVIPSFEVPPPAWFTDSSLHNPPSQATGETPPWCATDNVLFRTAIVAGDVHRFDDDFNLEGGEDVLFFKRVQNAGYNIVWCEEAVVHAHVPASRLTVRWSLQRAFRIGNSAVRMERRLDRRWKVALHRLLTGAAHLAGGVLLLPFALLRGRSAAVQRLQKLFVGLGQLSALAGVRYREYGPQRQAGEEWSASPSAPKSAP